MEKESYILGNYYLPDFIIKELSTQCLTIDDKLNLHTYVNKDYIRTIDALNSQLSIDNISFTIDCINNFIEIIYDEESYKIQIPNMDNIFTVNVDRTRVPVITHILIMLHDTIKKISYLSANGIAFNSKHIAILTGYHLFNNIINTLTNSDRSVLSIKIDEIESVIGDHILVRDSTKILQMEQLNSTKFNSSKMNTLIESKKRLYYRKKELNTVYIALLSDIKRFCDRVLETCRTLSLNKDKTVQSKHMYNTIKTNCYSLKGIYHVCDMVKHLETLHVEFSDLDVDEHRKYFELQLTELSRMVYDFNLGGSIESNTIDTLKTTKISDDVKIKSTYDKNFITDGIDQMKNPKISSLLNDISRLIVDEDVKEVFRFISGVTEHKKHVEQYVDSVRLLREDDMIFNPEGIDINTHSQHLLELSISSLLTSKYPFLSKFITDMLAKTVVSRNDTLRIISYCTEVTGALTNIDFATLDIYYKIKGVFTSLSEYRAIQFYQNNRLYSWNWSDTSIELNRVVTRYIREYIASEHQLALHIMILYDTITYIKDFVGISSTLIGTDVEFHIKGGFCRDLILSFFSNGVKDVVSDTDSVKTFNKSVKDIDVSMNIDPEVFTFYLCKIAVERYNIHPIKRWNNAEKTEKGKNISVWSVKLMEDFEPMEFVHFRTDEYDPLTSAVSASDIYSSLEDDLRRDIPWPSFRLNDMMIVDYFDIIGMMNRGEIVMRTPPRTDEVYILLEDDKIRPVNISDAKINYHTHLESAERVIRLFKFISPPFDSWFAYNYDITSKKFTQINKSGFTIHKDLINLYNPSDLSDTDNSVVLSSIHKYIHSWLKGGLLANVFKSVEKIARDDPLHFFRLFIDFRLLNVIFENNYDEEKVMKYSEIFTNMIKQTNTKLTLPYAVLGLGVKNKHEMIKHMKLLGLSNDTQILASFLADNSKHIFNTQDDRTIVENLIFSEISHTSCSYTFMYMVDLLKILDFDLCDIDVPKYTQYVIGVKVVSMYTSCVAAIVSEISIEDVLLNRDVCSDWIVYRLNINIINMITRTIGVPGVKDDRHIDNLEWMLNLQPSDIKKIKTSVRKRNIEIKKTLDYSISLSDILYDSTRINKLIKLHISNDTTLRFIEKDVLLFIVIVVNALVKILSNKDLLEKTRSDISRYTTVDEYIQNIDFFPKFKSTPDVFGFL